MVMEEDIPTFVVANFFAMTHAPYVRMRRVYECKMW